MQEHLGRIPFERICLVPPPGCATEEDVIETASAGRLCELDDGILVEKPTGWYESLLEGFIITSINNYLKKNKLGKVLGADGSLQILPGTIKIPDVSFISWNRWPNEKLPRRPIPALIPDLVVEVLSETNTKEEMDGKLKQYFQADVRLIWYIDPATKSAKAFTNPTDFIFVEAGGVLDGGEVLPGFQLSLGELFEHADEGPPE